MKIFPHHTFHNYRYRSARESLLQRLWRFHDDHPLPPRLNRLARAVLYQLRRGRLIAFTPRPRDGRDEYGDPVVPRQVFLAPRRPFPPPDLEALASRFREIHQVNEYLYNGDGSWEQGEHAFSYGSGVPIEEVAFRVLGYLGAHEAFRDPVYLERARQGGDYLLRERLFADGHLRLESHLVIELEYTFAALALVALYRRDRQRPELLQAACRIGDRLVDEHCTGCIDHSTIPAQALGPLYCLTGREVYLRTALRRVFKYAVALQLPYGGWAGPDSFTWYHSIITRSAIAAYVATPNTLAYYAKKDRLARCVTAGINRMLAAQGDTGRIKMGRGLIRFDYNYSRHFARFKEGCLKPVCADLDSYTGPYELDLLTSAFEELAVQPAGIAAHGYAAAMLEQRDIGRAEFDTFAVGRYASFLKLVQQLSKQTRRRLLVSIDQRATPSSETHPGSAESSF